MEDSNQIEVPPSFCALFSSPAGRLTEPIALVRERYELCEDLAQMLVEQASALQFKTGRPRGEVLQTMETGLTSADAAVSGAEASWVVTRLAELLGPG
ncbi:MAG: hypothetical protein AB7I35_03760 [Ramlibacter sp.]|nr:hypothetical protein [Ramlibacter sp.]